MSKVFPTWEKTQCISTICFKCNQPTGNCSCTRPMRYRKPPMRLTWFKHSSKHGIRKATNINGTAGKRGRKQKMPKYETFCQLKMEEVFRNMETLDAPAVQTCSSEMELNLELSFDCITEEELTAYLAHVEKLEQITSAKTEDGSDEWMKLEGEANHSDNIDIDIETFLNSITIPVSVPDPEEDATPVIAFEDLDLSLAQEMA
jgi:hypothetical protein